MQALLRLARRTSLLPARPSFQQGIVQRASSTQSEQEGGESVDGANAQVPQGGEGVVGEVPPFRVAGFPGVAPPARNTTTSSISFLNFHFQTVLLPFSFLPDIIRISRHFTIGTFRSSRSLI